MSDGKPQPTTADLLSTLIDEIRGLRDDMRRRSGLPDVRLGKNKKHPEYEGKVASESPPDVLLDYAGFLEWKAGQDREKGKEGYAVQAEREAVMCRRWAAANRGVVAAPEKQGFRRPEPKREDAAAEDAAQTPQPAGQRPGWGSGSGWKKAGVS